MKARITLTVIALCTLFIGGFLFYSIQQPCNVLYRIIEQNSCYRALSIENRYFGIDVSPDNTLFATSVRQNSSTVVQVRMVDTGAIIQEIPTLLHPEYFTFSYNGRLLAGTSLDGWVEVWRVQTGERIHTFPINGIDWYPVFSLDDTQLLLDNKVYDLQSGKQTQEIDKRRALDYDFRLSGWGIGLEPILSPNTQYSARPREISPDASINSGAVVIDFYDEEKNTIISSTKNTFPQDIIRFLFSPNSNYIVAWYPYLNGVSSDILVVINTRTAEVERQAVVKKGIDSIAWSTDETTIIVAERFGEDILFFDIQKQR